MYTGFGSSVVAVGRSGVFTPNLGTNGCPESFSRSGRFRVFGVKCRESYRAKKARLYDTTGAERFAGARTAGYADARVLESPYSGFELYGAFCANARYYEFRNNWPV